MGRGVRLSSSLISYQAQVGGIPRASFNPHMSTPIIRAFIQARMSSRRFPGKVLAPLNGQSIILRIISSVAQVIPLKHITVATSIEQSDDPLAAYVKELRVSVHRGSLDNVFERFQSCLGEYPCDWFFRICADSPLLDTQLIESMSSHAHGNADLVTNVQHRTFPKGLSLEMINADSFGRIDPAQLNTEEREHLTKVFYNHAASFNIVNIESGDPDLAKLSYAVDTLDDLFRLEGILSTEGVIDQAKATQFRKTA
jgi:spore coat polysaccharide biosynthesis protein SpsF